MGACMSCCTEEESRPAGDTTERTRLIDPVSNSSNNIQRVQSDESLARHPNSLPKRNDEHSALSRILQETATNVIDVMALDAHDLEQHEYYERMRAYNVKLNALKWPVPDSTCRLLVDVSSPEEILTSDPIEVDNLLLITNALERSTEALSQVKVEHTEDLVVPFGNA